MVVVIVVALFDVWLSRGDLNESVNIHSSFVTVALWPSVFVSVFFYPTRKTGNSSVIVTNRIEETKQVTESILTVACVLFFFFLLLFLLVGIHCNDFGLRAEKRETIHQTIQSITHQINWHESKNWAHTAISKSFEVLFILTKPFRNRNWIWFWMKCDRVVGRSNYCFFRLSDFQIACGEMKKKVFKKSGEMFVCVCVCKQASKRILHSGLPTSSNRIA